MMSGYYDELRTAPDAARRVGWRHAIEQAYRFEVVLDLVGVTRGRVLDVGCGLGAFRRYFSDRGFGHSWVGIEREPEFVEQCEAGDVICADYLEVAPGDLPDDIGCLVAVGALTGTEPSEGLRALVQLAVELAIPFAITASDARRLARNRPGLGTEPMIGAIRLEQAEHMMDLPTPWSTRIEPISETDLALFGWQGERPSFRTVRERFEAALDGPSASGVSAARAAWLALEVGLVERARTMLETLEERGPLARIVASRIELTAGPPTKGMT
jgi:hypothetical protein